MSTEIELAATVLDTPDPRGLGRFYAALLGWALVSDEPEWVKIQPPAGGSGLSFQLEPHYRPPRWPTSPDEAGMMLHLDFRVEELETSVARAEALGARQADYQPQDDVRVMLDPAGHPFCLFLPGA